VIVIVGLVVSLVIGVTIRFLRVVAGERALAGLAGPKIGDP
jgi:hypothetical protein